MTTRTPRRVAVVGSGVAGLTAAYVASRTAQVTLYESDDRLGGHADTHRVVDPEAGELAIDTGFIVHNERTYPVLLRLFDELGVPTQESEMSLSVSDDRSGVEWAGALGPRGLFPAAGRVRDPRHLRMLAEILRFHRRARRMLRGTTRDDHTTLEEFLAEGRFSPYFRRHFAEPLVAAVWSCDPAMAAQYPAAYLFRFLAHHGMLRIHGSPTWRTVTGGSRTYVDWVVSAIRASGGEVRAGKRVLAVRESAHDVSVLTAGGSVGTYDAVVVATHPDQALALLERPTALQQEVLGALPYTTAGACLHTDERLLPHAARARAAWNLRRPEDDRLRVTYDLTRLQRLPTRRRYLLTLGDGAPVDPAAVIARRSYAHPLYTPASVAARDRLPGIDSDRLAFAGAYHGWGFHEDGARSGLAAVRRLGLDWPRPAVATASYATTIRHTRRRPVHRTFRLRSHLWVVDLDRPPAPGRPRLLGPRFDPRDHFDGTASSVRAGLDGFLADSGVPVPAGRALMAAHPRALGHCFNPISVHWVWPGPTLDGTPAATVVEVHNTYGDRHAYLVRTDETGQGTVAKQMYVSPFHGTDGRYDVFAPPPDPRTGRLRVAVTLRTDDGARFDASLVGVPATPPRLPLAALRGSALIRLHGVALWLHGLPVRPRPVHPRGGAR